MIARLTAAIPFDITVPDGAAFHLYAYEEDGYTVVAKPPTRINDVPLANPQPETITIDEQPGFMANGLVIEFHKDGGFDRTPGAKPDPPMPVLLKALNSFLNRFRYVTRGAQVSLLQEHGFAWRLEYLNDDGSELPIEGKLLRARFAVRMKWSYVGLNPAVWDAINSSDSEFMPPVWDSLRLDALAALPSVGSAIVLASAALEVFIEHVLNAVVGTQATVPQTLWNWINNREDYRQEPSPREQFDNLLKILTGHSLKEDETLWQAFQNLRMARNKFVHEGIARIGNDAVTEAKATELVNRVNDIIKWVRQWLPEDCKWQEFDIPIKVEVAQILLKLPPATKPEPA